MDSQTYRVGQRLYSDGNRWEEYIIAQTGTNTVTLISLQNGNRWREPYHVGNVRAITRGEMEEIAGEGFTPTPAEEEEPITENVSPFRPQEARW